MSVDAQRIRRRATEIREARRLRTRAYDAERDGPEGDDDGTLEPDPDVGAAVRTPVETPADRVARTEGVSTMRTVTDMEGLDALVVGDAGGIGTEIRRLGYELGEQVDARVENALEAFREELGEGTGTKTPRGFVFGSLYGAALTLGGFAAALILTRLGRRD